MSQVLVIDGRSRALRAFVASATQAQPDNRVQLVLRHALDLGYLPAMLASSEDEINMGRGETKCVRRFRTPMPVILGLKPKTCW